MSEQIDDIEIPLPNDPNEIPLPSTRPSSPNFEELNDEIILNVQEFKQPSGIKKSFKSPVVPRPVRNFSKQTDCSNQTLAHLLTLNDKLQTEVRLKIDLVRKRLCEIQTRSIMIESKISAMNYSNRLHTIHRKKVKWRKQGRDTIASFYKPYFFSRNSSTCPYTDFATNIDDNVEYRNPLNEVKDLLGKFDGTSISLNQKHDFMIENFVRNESEYKVIISKSFFGPV